MKAAWIEEFGGIDVIKIGVRPMPERSAGEVFSQAIHFRRGKAGWCTRRCSLWLGYLTARVGPPLLWKLLIKLAAASSVL